MECYFDMALAAYNMVLSSLRLQGDLRLVYYLVRDLVYVGELV